MFYIAQVQRYQRDLAPKLKISHLNRTEWNKEEVDVQKYFFCVHRSSGNGKTQIIFLFSQENNRGEAERAEKGL